MSEPLSLSRSYMWNCIGAVMTQATDENGRNTNWTYNDPNFWRVKAVQDPASATTNISYVTTPAFASESTLNFNGTTSTSDTRVTLDSLGRSHILQRRQTQGGSTYDSVEADYDALGRPSKTTIPYSGTGRSNKWRRRHRHRI